MGCATLQDDGTIDLRKDVGKVGEVSARLGLTEMAGRRGMIQLRWATFGAPSQINAQPHLDSDDDLVGAHNGKVSSCWLLTAHLASTIVVGRRDRTNSPWGR